MERASILRSQRSHGEKPLDRKDIKFKFNRIIQCFLISIVLGQIRSLNQSDIIQTRLSFLCSTNQEPERVIFSSLNQSKAGILSPKPIKNRTRLRFSHNQLKVLDLHFLNQSNSFSQVMYSFIPRVIFSRSQEKGSVLSGID